MKSKTMSPVRNLVSPGVAERAGEFRFQFETAEPFPHVVIDDFLDSGLFEGLIAEFPPFDERRALNEHGQVGGKSVEPNLALIGEHYRRLDQLLRSAGFLELISQVTGIPSLLFDPDYTGGGTHENLHGQELDPHIDFNYHPRTHLHRRLNLILFLNPEWKPEWGGCLELHRDPHLPPHEDFVREVVPLANRCVIFETSERSWHGFRRIETPEDKRHLSRRSVAVYYYTKERPAEETALDHSTVYVPRPLPEHIREGRTLTAGDMAEIRSLLQRRDTQIEFLYERERRFAATLAAIHNSPTFRVARAITWAPRKLRDWLKGRRSS